MATPTEVLCFYATAGGGLLLALRMHVALVSALVSAMNAGPGLCLGANARVQRLWWGVVGAAAVTTALSFAIRPNLADSFDAAPWGCAFPVIALAGLLGVALCTEPEAETMACFSSCALLMGMAGTAAFIAGASVAWWVGGMALTAACAIFTSVFTARGQVDVSQAVRRT